LGSGTFGVLQRVDLRMLWPKEALDVTAWLALNLDALGSLIRLDLGHQATHGAGRHPADPVVLAVGCP